MAEPLSPPLTLGKVRNRPATTSLVLGILGWTIYLSQWCFDLTLGLVLMALTAGLSAICSTVLDVLPFGLWLGGLVSGHIALNQIRLTGAPGKGSALWGLLLSYFGVFFSVIIIVAVTLLIVTGVRAGWVEKLLPGLVK